MVKEGGEEEWVLYQSTEVIWENCNPSFIQTLSLKFEFQRIQRIKLELVNMGSVRGKSNSTVGSCVFLLSEILMAPDMSCTYKLLSAGNGGEVGEMVVKGCLQYSEVKFLKVRLSIQNIRKVHTCFCFLARKPSTFIRIYRKNNFNHLYQIYQSEVQAATCNPQFNQITLNLG